MIFRPFCDIKDVSLFELSVVDTSATPDDTDKLSCLRMIRNHLNSHEDHLNFCRENGYLQLTMLFSIHYNDTKYGHAILDILDEAIGFRFSGRYLIERCDIRSWLTQTILAGKNQLSAFHSFGASHGHRQSNKPSYSHERSDVMNSVLVCRLVVLLRKVSGSLFLHLSEGSLSDNAPHLEEAIETLVKYLCDTVDQASSNIPVNYFRQILLAMWEEYLLEASRSVKCLQIKSSGTALVEVIL